MNATIDTIAIVVLLQSLEDLLAIQFIDLGTQYLFQPTERI